MIPYAALALACVALAALTAVACVVAWVREDRAAEQLRRYLDSWGAS